MQKKATTGVKSIKDDRSIIIRMDPYTSLPKACADKDGKFNPNWWIKSSTGNRRSKKCGIEVNQKRISIHQKIANLPENCKHQCVSVANSDDGFYWWECMLCSYREKGGPVVPKRDRILPL